MSIPVQVETDEAGKPAAFTWRGIRRRVQVIGYWHLRDRWWVSQTEADRAGKGFSDRQYYRLITADHQVFEIYCELTSAGLWVLDVIQD